jgi:phage terminase Nu1 subunit (DNA packaging protein)
MTAQVHEFRPLAEVVPLEPWVDKKTIANHFGVSWQTVDRWRQRGCPHKRIGNAVRFRLTAVDAWFQKEGTP